MAQPLMALGVNTPDINTVGNYLGAQKAATDMKSEQINQAGAQQQQEAASLEHIAQLGFGVMGGKLDGPIDPKRLDTMITLLGDNPLGAKLKANPELLRTITEGSAAVAAQSQDAQKFELAKQQLDLQLKEYDQKLSAPPPAPETKTIYDDKTGREQVVEWDGSAWTPVGGNKAEPAGNGITITNPDGTTTQIGGAATKAPVAYDVEDAKQRVKQSAEIVSSANSARDQKAKLGKMKDLLSNDKVYTGIGAQQVEQLQRAAVAFGVADASSIKDTESFSALTKAAVLDKMGGSLGTGVSNADRDYIDGQVPSLANTKEGNLQLIDIMSKLAQRQIDIAQQMNDFKKSHDGRLTYEWDQTMADWAEKNPLFKDEAAKADAADPSKMSDDELLKQLNLN